MWGTGNSLSKERIFRRGLSFRSDPLEPAWRGNQRPKRGLATTLSRSNPNAPRTLRPPTLTLSQTVPTMTVISFSISNRTCDRNGSHIHRFRIEGFVPGRVEPTHSGSKIRSITVLGGDVPGVLRNTVVNSVDSFDEFLQRLSSFNSYLGAFEGENYLVQFQPERIDGGVFQLYVQSARNNFSAEVSVGGNQLPPPI